MWNALAAAGLLSAAAVAGITTSYNRDIAAARAVALAGSKIAQTARGPIEYAIRGDGSPVLSIHGAGGGWDQGLIIAEMLGSGHRFIAPSRFGYLRTPVPSDSSFAAQADAHAALLDTLRIDRAVIVGTSAGATSAVEFALRYPERTSALILLVPRGYAPEGSAAVDDAMSSRIVMNVVMRGADFAWWSLSRLSRGSVVRFLGVPPEVDSQASPEAQAKTTRMIESILPLSARLKGLEVEGAHEVTPRPLEEIKAPTLVISAKDDLFRTLPAARYAAEHIPGAKLIVFETGGHLFVDRETEVEAAVTSFLSQLAERASLPLH
jgi:pimeloyl-ACP methyl ester carboxylesterase